MQQKTYVLGMFPYPSGEGLHVGHVRIFTACDVMARYFRMKGRGDNKVSDPLADSVRLGPPKEPSVLSPMGWDAFGLPAENAAIKNKRIPQEMVPHNYANFKKQMQNLSLSFDWERELATTDPEYYAITQWIFLQLYKKGLVYREEVAINWCPKCKTGLANEEVMADGTHERCGTVVGKKNLPQWVMKITAYAERLLNDLDMDLKIEGKKLDSSRKGLDWPRGILEMQRNWIGKKEGINVNYPVVGTDEVVTCFTTAPVNFGMTFIVLAPEHEIVKKILNGTIKVEAKHRQEVEQYVQATQKKSEVDRMQENREKTGTFTGLKATNVVAGWEVPIYIADFVLGHVGTGAVQGCPGHDYKDYEFAKKFNLPIMRVVVGPDGDTGPIDSVEKIIVKGMKGKMVNSQFLDGLEFSEGLHKTMDYIEEKGWGKRTISYHLRDWVFSRQRYWGEPIPLVYCEQCGDENGVVAIPEDQLPLTLPLLDYYEPTDTGESPLARVTDWVSTKCPQCGGPARRETDTMPNWAGSCWYFLAYPFWAAKKAGEKINNLNDAKKYIKQWMPVDWYLGGAEHAVLHLLYARFWVKVLQDLGIVDFPEPFLRLRSVGMVLAEDGRKMSKSLGNVVNPDDMIAKYGSDAVRMYEMFMGPWEQSIAWDSGAISGQVRFLGRITETAKQAGKVGETTTPELAAKLKNLVERVEEGVLNQKFNTAIAGLMEWVNMWRTDGVMVAKEHLGVFASLLSLFAPITAEELGVGENPVWPDVSQIKGVDEINIKIAVQVNGKLRGVIEVGVQEAGDQEVVVMKAKQDERIKKWLSGEPKKVIWVPGKLVNLVV